MKRCLSFAVLSGATAAMISCSGSPEGVSLPRAETPASVQEAVDSIIAADERMDEVRFESIMVLKHGKVIFEQWYNGASADKPHVMHSVSKTFTSTAIGMAIDEGLLSIDDRVVDFFPDKLPQDVSDNLNLKLLDLSDSPHLKTVYVARGQKIQTIIAENSIEFKYKD